jgi:hypothetical protein
MRLPHQSPPVLRSTGRKVLFEQVLKEVSLRDGGTKLEFQRGTNINSNAPMYFEFPTSFFNAYFLGNFSRF